VERARVTQHARSLPSFKDPKIAVRLHHVHVRQEERRALFCDRGCGRVHRKDWSCELVL
jgi:hypothetical protein